MPTKSPRKPKSITDFAKLSRDECISALEDLQTQRKKIGEHLAHLLSAKSGDLRPQLIASLVTAEAICIDKQHHVLMRLRDLESFGVEESTEIGAVVIQRDDDGTESIVGEPPAWAALVAKAGPGPHS